MLSEPRFSTLIVTFNSCSNVLPLITDINKQAPSPSSKIIVVDNASSDGTSELIKAHFPDVSLITNQDNLGFGKAVNQGFATCDTEYFFLMNPDLRIPDPNLFTSMIECIEQCSSIAAVGPLQFKQCQSRLRLNFTWSYWNPRAFGLYLKYKLNDHISSNSPIVVTFLNAGCLLLRSSAFRTIGMLNEQYFLYGEEPDLFLKFKEHGYQCRLLPSTHVIHHREQSIKTLGGWTRILLKILSIYNILHALLSGSIRIVRKKFTNSKIGCLTSHWSKPSARR